MRKLILKNERQLGDTVAATAAVYALHRTYPGQFQTYFKNRYKIWENCTYQTVLNEGDKDVEVYTMEYPINSESPSYLGAFRAHLEAKLGVKIKKGFCEDPIMFLTDDEACESVTKEILKQEYRGYWVINGSYLHGGKTKYYPYWQEVIDILKKDVLFIQAGSSDAINPELKGVVNMVGQTTFRQYYRLVYQSHGTVGPVSNHFLIAAAFNRRSVVVAGGKEPVRWQQLQGQQYLHTCGMLPCCPRNGCWLGDISACTNRVGSGAPRCYAMISPETVATAILNYYKGGYLSH